MYGSPVAQFAERKPRDSERVEKQTRYFNETQEITESVARVSARSAGSKAIQDSLRSAGPEVTISCHLESLKSEFLDIPFSILWPLWAESLAFGGRKVGGSKIGHLEIENQ